MFQPVCTSLPVFITKDLGVVKMKAESQNAFNKVGKKPLDLNRQRSSICLKIVLIQQKLAGKVFLVDLLGFSNASLGARVVSFSYLFDSVWSVADAEIFLNLAVPRGKTGGGIKSRIFIWKFRQKISHALCSR